MCGSSSHDSRWVVVALALHVLIGTIYSVSVPAWEAHDEWGHYKYVEYVARYHTLPSPVRPLTTELCCDQADQPPLYYILAALPVTLVDTSGDLVLQVNPYMSLADGVGGNNATLHDARVERFPWRGAYMGLHLARLVSVALSTVGVLATYRLAQLLAPDRREVAQTALALAAFWPQYLFIGSVVTNDILVAALGCVVTMLAVEVVLRGPVPRTLFGLILAVGLSLLTKASALALVPVVLLALLFVWRVRRHHIPISRTARVALAVGALAMGLGVAVWFWHNQRLTGYILPRYPWFPYWFLDRLAGRGQVKFGAGWPGLVPSLRYAFITVWASFGWGNLGAYPSVYWLFGLLCLAGFTGLLLSLTRSRPDRERLLGVGLLIALILSLIALVGGREFLYGTYRLRGRMLLPGLAAAATLLALGLGEWSRRLPERWRAVVPAALGTTLVIVNLILALRLIPAAYAPPRILSEAELKPNEQPLHARFGDAAEIVGYGIEPAKASPGQSVEVTLLWRALAEFDQNYTLSIQVLGPDGQQVGGLNIYPGRGNFATTLWQPGDIFRETYRVPLQQMPAQPCLGNIRVAFFLPGAELQHLAAFDANGTPIGDAVIFGRLKLAPRTTQVYRRDEPILARLGDAIVLVSANQEPAGSVTAGSAVTLTLTWEALGALLDDYTVFVHLAGPQCVVAQGDGPPAGGAYPTGLWEGGERILDSHLVALPRDLPPGDYQWRVGLYAEGGLRLPAFDPAGARFDHDQVTLGYLTVTAPDLP